MSLRKPNIRRLIAMSHDFFAVITAWWLAYLLRFNFDIPPGHMMVVQQTLLFVVPIQVTAFLVFGLYRGVWRYASLPDLRRILSAVLAGTAVVLLTLFLLQILVGVPRSILLLDPILLLLMMGGSRLVYRIWKEDQFYGVKKSQGPPVLILGSGYAAISLIKDLSRSTKWRVVGLLDDDPRRQKMILHGSKVLGRIDELPALTKKMGVAHAIIAMPSASHNVRRRALEMCASSKIKALTVPSYDDLISGKVMVSQVHKVELDDLLGRDSVILDNVGLQSLLTGKTVLVTGAGGSVGSELCRQIEKFAPARLVFFELNELALYSIEQEFRCNFPDIQMAFIIGDIKNPARLAQVFEQFRPTVVFHAAAYKHVPLMEQDNAWQAVLNNVLGTHMLAQAALTNGVERFILVSTDKAVNPTNVMGASKRLAEMVCQAMHQNIFSADKSSYIDGKPAMHFVIVRFGNVLGSTGSVIPKFNEQIAKGGPVTVTHPEITRYFMSIPEAAQLVLQAAFMGGENGGGNIFVLDMGEPLKIADLAKDLIRLSGFSKEEIGIVYSGLRPGEKLYEELLADNESNLPTQHAKLSIAQSRQVDKLFLTELLVWLNQYPELNDELVKQGLAKWVPEYSGKKV
ncbi:polysaccharide biosynthesis protein [Nitrosomonadaceae bacterium]|nr:polysaccharide biosynthesis protein [Nitrosomonadaceae bacterium]